MSDWELRKSFIFNKDSNINKTKIRTTTTDALAHFYIYDALQ